MFKIFTFSILIITTFVIIAQNDTRTYLFDKNAEPRERFVDFTDLKLTVAFEPEEKLVRGKVEHSFTVLRNSIDTLFLDGIKMRYTNVLLNGVATDYDTSGIGITLKFNPPLKRGEIHLLSIDYEATPKKGLYFVGWDDSTGRSRKQIWTQGQGIDNRHWIPMYDERNDKVISEILVSFEKGFEVLSNGTLIEKNENFEEINYWNYKISHPHSPYLIMLGIGKYGIEKDTSFSGVPLKYYYYSEQQNQIEPTYRFTKEMFDFFEKEIGVAYPWETYSQIPVQNFMYGAMENTTATIFGDFYLVDSSEFLDRNYVRVNAHELAHQWFGDMVTARSAKDHWLQESFATHFDLMYQKEAFGQDFYDWVRRKYANQSITASEKDLKPLAHSEAGSTRHYPKGAFVLQMLKYVIGKEDFNLGVKDYLERHSYQNVDSDDLLSSFHESLGWSLDWFWEDWVYQGGEPNYLVKFIEKRGKGTFEVIQNNIDTTLTGNFKMPLNFEIHLKDGTIQKRKVWIEDDTTLVEFDLKKKNVSYVLFDPNSEVMKTLMFEKSPKMWKEQAVNSEFMLDRYDAIIALKSQKMKKKEAFLAERFNVESFQAIRSEILRQLSESDSEIKKDIFVKALKDSDVDIRKAALMNLHELDEVTKPLLIKLLDDPSNELVAGALEVLVVKDFENGRKYLELSKELMGNRSFNVRIIWLKIAALAYREEKYLNELVDFSSNSFEFLTRINAFSAIKDIQYLTPKVMENLVEARFHFNSTLRRSAAATLDFFYSIDGLNEKLRNYLKVASLTENQKKSLKKYMEH